MLKYNTSGSPTRMDSVVKTESSIRLLLADLITCCEDRIIDSAAAGRFNYVRFVPKVLGLFQQTHDPENILTRFRLHWLLSVVTENYLVIFIMYIQKERTE